MRSLGADEHVRPRVEGVHHLATVDPSPNRPEIAERPATMVSFVRAVGHPKRVGTLALHTVQQIPEGKQLIPVIIALKLCYQRKTTETMLLTLLQSDTISDMNFCLSDLLLLFIRRACMEHDRLSCSKQPLTADECLLVHFLNAKTPLTS